VGAGSAEPGSGYAWCSCRNGARPP
jgi:hypothetical protein